MQSTRTRARTWRVWDRPNDPRSFRIQPRDIKILATVFQHRFVRPAHIHALLPDGSPANLNRRLALLWQNGYLERPKGQRPTKILNEEIVYALANPGARLLEELDPRLNIGRLEWNDRTRRPLGFPYMDHQLGVATFFVVLERACAAVPGIRLEWPGHYERQKYRIPIPGEDKRIHPDGYFRLVRSDGRVAHHFLELARSTRTLEAMQRKYEGYFQWWQAGAAGEAFKHFRVITIAPDKVLMNALRRAAAPVGRNPRYPSTWRALWFSHLAMFTLAEPEQILGPIFRYADEDTAIQLL